MKCTYTHIIVGERGANFWSRIWYEFRESGISCGIQASYTTLLDSELCMDTQKVKVKSLSRVRLFTTPGTVAHQAPTSMGFSRQEYWSVLPFHSPGHLPDPGIEPRSPALQKDALTSEPPGKPKHGVKCIIAEQLL